MKHSMGAATPSNILNSVVKIICTHSEPDHSLPWQKKPQKHSTSSGFIIRDRWILTNAHSVENYLSVKVKKRSSDKKYRATVLSIGNECDIALLTVDCEEFWADMQALEIGEEPLLQESVSIIGFPIGGVNISVTAGVVSRIEMQQYSHSSCELLCIQIDAAINSGNSGGPALNAHWRCVGIAFQSLMSSDAENIGYIIPWEVVSHFLNEYIRRSTAANATKEFIGFASCGFDWQCMENGDLRESKKMDAKDSGVLITHCYPVSDAFSKLQVEDVLTHFDGIPIANDGTISFRNDERISFHYLKTRKYIGDTCALQIIRGGARLEIALALVPIEAPQLVAVHDTQHMPNYLIIGGLVIVELSGPYLLAEFGEDYEHKADVKLLDKALHGKKDYPDHKALVLSHVLSHDVNEGYEFHRNVQLLTCNGARLLNLTHLATLVDTCTDTYLHFQLEYHDIIVINTTKARLALSDILHQHNIVNDRLLPGSLPGSATKRIKMSDP